MPDPTQTPETLKRLCEVLTAGHYDAQAMEEAAAAISALTAEREDANKLRECANINITERAQAILRAEQAEAERDAANDEAEQARHDADEAAVWPDWARQMLGVLERYGYVVGDGDEIDLPQDMAEWLDGYDNDRACRIAIERAEQAEEKLREISGLVHVTETDVHEQCIGALESIATISRSTSRGGRG